MDWISRNIYITDPGREVIEVVSLDTKRRSVYTDKKENQIFLIYKEIHNGAVARSYMNSGLPIWGNICVFPQILVSPSSYITLQLLHSEFPYI